MYHHKISPIIKTEAETKKYILGWRYYSSLAIEYYLKDHQEC